jgi:hypothetical protein
MAWTAMSLALVGVACDRGDHAADQQNVALTPGDASVTTPGAAATTLLPARDTSVRDGIFANVSFGVTPTLFVNQALIAFDQQSLAALTAAGQQVVSAELEVTVTGNPLPRGRRATVGAFRLTHDWSETRATWNCAADTNLADGHENCAAANVWNMGEPSARRPNPWSSPATGSASISAGQAGRLTFDVTADVRGFVSAGRPNFGWILQSDEIDDLHALILGSRMSKLPPRLLVTLGCASGRADCDHNPANGCEQALNVVTNCGGCGVSCDDHNPCTADSCDAQKGCLHVPVSDGIACDDGSACTQQDSCLAGVCAGSPVICGAADECHAAGSCDPTTGACTNPVAADGSACDDGNACTQQDSCLAGVCAGSPVVCGAADQCHAAGSCDPQSGACTSLALADGTGCDDKNACTQGDSCLAGACVGAPVSCAAADECHAAGACDPQSGACTSPALADGTTCSDGNACSQGDHCQAGACQSGTPVVCPATDGCHPGLCDAASGACSNPVSCQLYGVGSVPGSATDGLAVSPLILEDGTPNNQIGGFGSAIAYTGAGNLFIATPDRGPGAGADSYTERYYLIELGLSGGQVTPTFRGAAVLDQGLGLPTLIGLDTAFDAANSPASRRFDSEGVRVGAQGSFFVSDEYGPFLYEFGPDGHRLRALNVPDKFLIDHPGIEDAELPPANLKGRQDNRGMEGLAITPDGGKLYGLMQSPLIQDGALSPSGDRIGVNVRMLEVDVQSGQTRELLYQLDDPAFGNNELLSINDHQFLAIERDSKSGTSAKVKKLFMVDISAATDVSGIAALPATGAPDGVVPVKKTLFLDLLDPTFGLGGASFPEKVEGMSFGPDLPDGRHTLVVTTDNDFIATQSSQLLVFAIDAAALPGFQPQRASFPNLCAGPPAVSCPAAGVCQLPGVCDPGTGACSAPVAAAGTPVAQPAAGDCLRSTCDGQGNSVTVADDTDLPVDGNPCTADVCASGVPSNPPLAAGTSCSLASGAAAECDGNGGCVDCQISGTCGGGTSTPPPAPPTFRVMRVGDGAAALSSAAAAVFIEERRLDGTLVGTVALPTAASGANLPLAVSGSASSEGALTLSADGHWLSLAGYAAAPGTAGVASTATSAVNRVVGRIDALGNVDTSTAFTTAFTANNVRGAASADGSGFWVAGAGGSSGGIWFISLGGQGGGVQIAINPNSVRWPELFGGQLYASASSGTFVNVFTIGSGLPIVGLQTDTSLPGLPISGSSSPFAFVFVDANPVVPGPDVLYVADDRSAAKGGGVQKWTFNGVTWTLLTTFNVATSPNGFRGLAGSVAGGTVTLIGSTADDTNRLAVFVDDGTAGIVGSVIATAGANTAFRGVALSPQN